MLDTKKPSGKGTFADRMRLLVNSCDGAYIFEDLQLVLDRSLGVDNVDDVHRLMKMNRNIAAGKVAFVFLLSWRGLLFYTDLVNQILCNVANHISANQKPISVNNMAKLIDVLLNVPHGFYQMSSLLILDANGNDGKGNFEDKMNELIDLCNGHCIFEGLQEVLGGLIGDVDAEDMGSDGHEDDEE
jgi:hypothetical protein